MSLWSLITWHVCVALNVSHQRKLTTLTTPFTAGINVTNRLHFQGLFCNLSQGLFYNLSQFRDQIDSELHFQGPK